ncbi:MAG TPA: T9SS type A sorting domain-containing protein, partial [Aequorivita sp.]|nr:T9SS type A sorting domain-containing protein [Aequorivita sp.]
EFFPSNELSSLNFITTTNDCGIQQHNSFEDEYFAFISGGYWYTITEDSEGKVLTFESALMGYAVFKNYPLSTSDFQKNKFQIYPNPTKNELYLRATNTTANLKVKIFNAAGKLLNTQILELENQSSIAISQLATGIYFLNIQDENGNTTIKKFLKE